MKKVPRKLRIPRETIRLVLKRELADIVGGDAGTAWSKVAAKCNTGVAADSPTS
jgi:hypothetical protein